MWFAIVLICYHFLTNDFGIGSGQFCPKVIIFLSMNDPQVWDPGPVERSGRNNTNKSLFLLVGNPLMSTFCYD